MNHVSVSPPNSSSSLGIEFAPPAAICPLCDGPIFAWGEKTRGGQSYHYDRCRACDFVFVNPRPTEASLANYYACRTGHEILQPETNVTAPAVELPDPGKWPTRAISDLLAIGKKAGAFLDVGAGGGAFTIAALRAGLRATALELDPADQTELARLPGAHVVTDSFEKFDPPEASFDYVLMSHVLEHAHDPRLWIEKTSRILSPGGLISIMTPHFGSVYRRLGGTRDPYFFPPEHLNHFNRRSLVGICERFGIRCVTFRTVGEIPRDAVTRRIAMPQAIKPMVRTITAIAGMTIESFTRATGTGSVLVFLGKRVTGRK